MSIYYLGYWRTELLGSTRNGQWFRLQLVSQVNKGCFLLVTTGTAKCCAWGHVMGCLMQAGANRLQSTWGK